MLRFLNKDTEKGKGRLLVQTQNDGQTQPNLLAAHLWGEAACWEGKVLTLIKGKWSACLSSLAS